MLIMFGNVRIKFFLVIRFYYILCSDNSMIYNLYCRFYLCMFLVKVILINNWYKKVNILYFFNYMF